MTDKQPARRPARVVEVNRRDFVYKGRKLERGTVLDATGWPEVSLSHLLRTFQVLEVSPDTPLSDLPPLPEVPARDDDAGGGSLGEAGAGRDASPATDPSPEVEPPAAPVDEADVIARVRAGEMTQPQAAEALGVSQSTVSRKVRAAVAADDAAAAAA